MAREWDHYVTIFSTNLKQNKEFYEKLKYCIIEKSEAMRQKEKEGHWS